MGKESAIQWTDATWNVARGCTKVDEDFEQVTRGVAFLSAEPLTGPLDLSDVLPGQEWHDSEHAMWGPLDWVIVGGESGNDKGKYRYRECRLEWIQSIVDQCQAAGVPVFVKQFGTYLAKKMGLKDRHGGDINEWPSSLRVRQFPKIFDEYFKPTV